MREEPLDAKGRSAVSVQVDDARATGTSRMVLPVRVVVQDPAGEHPDGSDRGVYTFDRLPGSRLHLTRPTSSCPTAVP